MMLVLSPVLFVLWTSSSVLACPKSATSHYDVVIIGAGMAGLSAGKTLLEGDPNINFVILEAQDGRVGGRVRSNEVWFHGHTVEEGANWFSDNTANPGLQLANRYNVDMFIQDFEDFNVYEYNQTTNDVSSLFECSPPAALFFLYSLSHFVAATDTQDALLVDEREVADSAQFYYNIGFNCIQKEALKLFKEEGKPLFDPLSDGVQAVLREQCRWENRTNLDNFQDWFNTGYEFAEQDTSMYSYPIRKYFISKFFLIKDQDGGFEKLPKSFAEEYLLSEGASGYEESEYFRFNQRVGKIFYDKGGVYPVEIETNFKGKCPARRFKAKRAILTAGVGVQNSGEIVFDPPFPYPSPMKMALYVKVFYQFEEKFWKEMDDRQFIVSLAEDFDGATNAKCHHWQSLDYSSDLKTGPKKTSPDIVPGSKILFCTLLTEAFEALLDEAGSDELTEKQLKVELLEPLRRIYGEKVDSTLVDVKYPKLHKDPNFMGSYENWQVGFDLEDYYKYHGGILPGSNPIIEPCGHNGCMRDNTTWTLHISGSASCLEEYGYVRGAIDAGERSANYVLADIGCGGSGCSDVSTESSCDNLFVNNGNRPKGGN